MRTPFQRKSIGALCEVIAGQSPEGRFYNVDGQGMPFYQGKKDFGDKFITDPTAWTTKSTKVARDGDILMSVRAPVGPVNVATGQICIGRGLAAIRANAGLNREFLFYQLLSLQPQIAGREGAVFPSISKSEIEALPIAVPPPSEQARIVSILDEAFEGIAKAKANAEKNLQNAHDLYESYLQSVFTNQGRGWVEKPLGSFATFRNGINYTKDSKGERINVVGVRHFQRNFAAPLNGLDSVTIDGSLRDHDVLREDDILVVRSNGNRALIGRCLLVGKVTGKTSHSGFTIRMRLARSEVLPRYLCHFLKTASSRKRLTEGGTGTNIKSLNQAMLATLAVPFPPVPAQRQIVDELENVSEHISRLEALYEQKLVAREALKASLLHQAFTGKL